MIRPAALGLAAAMTAVSAGTYFGLDLLPPGALGPFGRAVPDAGAAATPAPRESTETAAAAAPAQPAPAEPVAPAQQPVTEEDLAEEPPPDLGAPAEPAPQAQAAAEPAPAAAEPAAPAPEPEPEPEPAPVPAPAPKPKQAAPAPATEVAKADEEPSAPKQQKKAPPEADVIKPWWPDASKMPANQLKLQYAGQVQGEQAIALLFSSSLDIATLKQHAQVRTLSGDAVKGEWELGRNPRLAVFRGVGSGRFTVILDPRVADTKGFMLGTKLQGPVYIQAQ